MTDNGQYVKNVNILAQRARLWATPGRDKSFLAPGEEEKEEKKRRGQVNYTCV